MNDGRADMTSYPNLAGTAGQKPSVVRCGAGWGPAASWRELQLEVGSGSPVITTAGETFYWLGRTCRTVGSCQPDLERQWIILNSRSRTREFVNEPSSVPKFVLQGGVIQRRCTGVHVDFIDTYVASQLSSILNVNPIKLKNSICVSLEMETPFG